MVRGGHGDTTHLGDPVGEVHVVVLVRLPRRYGKHPAVRHHRRWARDGRGWWRERRLGSGGYGLGVVDGNVVANATNAVVGGRAGWQCCTYSSMTCSSACSSTHKEAAETSSTISGFPPASKHSALKRSVSLSSMAC